MHATGSLGLNGMDLATEIFLSPAFCYNVYMLTPSYFASSATQKAGWEGMERMLKNVKNLKGLWAKDNVELKLSLVG